ncbi:MAG TPA: DUF362 domain-containing protein [Gemmataceae bacterium]|nr:DUF362 domain-containing protein [Gemmataceae bacterium]
MTSFPYDPGCCVNRRAFLLGAGAGLAAGTSLTWLGLRGLRSPDVPTRPSIETPHPGDGMPGPYRGRVIEVRHRGAVRPDHTIRPDAVKGMMARGLCELTGADHVADAWRRFFQADDVVGIKVNPVGRNYRARRPVAISSPEVVLQVVAGLKSAGVRPRDIILLERYADQFRGGGYEALLLERSMSGVRWYASSAQYDDRQVDIEGYDLGDGRDPHVLGYDPDVFVPMGFASPLHDPKDDRRFRSHLSLAVSRMINKLVTIPVLKDHGSAGVTLALKNMSHGLHNNVARSHIGDIHRGADLIGPNQCNTFIPTAAAQPLLRQKATLHILDGLIAVYQGGPSVGLSWHRKSLFFATDPVALDRVGWDIINAKRRREGMPAVEEMGLYSGTPAGRQGEAFDRRQPEHIYLAATLGLGVFDTVDHRAIELTS